MLCLGKLLLLLFLLSDLDWRLVSVGNSKSSSSSSSLLLSFCDSLSVAASDSESFFCWFVKENVYNNYEGPRAVALGGKLFVKTLPKVLKNQPGPELFATRSILDSTVICDVTERLACPFPVLTRKTGQEKTPRAKAVEKCFKSVESKEHRRGDKVNCWIFKGCGLDSGMLQDTFCYFFLPGFLHLHLGFRLYKLVQCALQNIWLPGTNGNWNIKPIELSKAGKLAPCK